MNPKRGIKSTGQGSTLLHAYRRADSASLHQSTNGFFDRPVWLPDRPAGVAPGIYREDPGCGSCCRHRGQGNPVYSRQMPLLGNPAKEYIWWHATLGKFRDRGWAVPAPSQLRVVSRERTRHGRAYVNFVPRLELFLLDPAVLDHGQESILGRGRRVASGRFPGLVIGD